MVYIEKKPCPANVQADIDRITGKPKWKAFPEQPSSKEAQDMRRNFFNALDKRAVRAALLAEQHGICAYCMDRIRNDGSVTTIEHLIPLSKSKAGAMSYQNWLGVCKGGANVKLPQNKKRVLCCDAKKSNSITLLSPLNRAQMDGIAYYEDGTIYSRAFSDPDHGRITSDLNTIFALNGVVDSRTGHSQRDTSTGIVKKRKDAYIAMYEPLEQMHLSGELTLDFIHRLRQDLLGEEKWEPFIGVKLYVLRLFEEFLTNP